MLNAEVVKGIKLCLFDFDDTLCIHTDRANRMGATEYTRSILSGGNPWKEAIPSKTMAAFMRVLAGNGARLGLISATQGYVHMEGKLNWVHDNYHFRMENYSVSDTDGKLCMLEALQLHLGVAKDELLLVDDLYSTLDKVTNAGFLACSPMEVVCFMESYEGQVTAGGDTIE